MAISFDKALGIHQQALSLREQRQSVLAANIANADTPGYQARDVDFRSALASTQGSSNGEGLAMKVTNQNHIARGNSTQSNSEPIAPKYRVPTQPSEDGNTVESHIEQAAFADNTTRYQTTLHFLSGRFASMKNVISGGR